jgi:hypothetical protein
MNSGDLTEARPAFAALLGTVLVVAIGPALVAGVVVGELLHRRRLRFTWTLLACGPAWALAAPFALRGVSNAHAAVGAARDEHLAPLSLLAMAWPWWLALSPVVATAWQLRRARRDGLHGGRAEYQLGLQLGPVDYVMRRRRNARELAAAPGLRMLSGPKIRSRVRPD